MDLAFNLVEFNVSDPDVAERCLQYVGKVKLFFKLKNITDGTTKLTYLLLLAGQGIVNLHARYRSMSMEHRTSRKLSKSSRTSCPRTSIRSPIGFSTSTASGSCGGWRESHLTISTIDYWRRLSFATFRTRTLNYRSKSSMAVLCGCAHLQWRLPEKSNHTTSVRHLETHRHVWRVSDRSGLKGQQKSTDQVRYSSR